LRISGKVAKFFGKINPGIYCEYKRVDWRMKEDFWLFTGFLLMNNLSGNWEEWLTVSTYLGLTVFVIWCVFASQKPSE
jgi:hypothetical protein